MLLADRGYDADWIRELAMKKGSWANVPRRAIAAIRSASAPISIPLATKSSGSSTGSNNVAGWRRATTGLPPTILPSFSSRQSGYGCALMSPRPRSMASQTTSAGEVRLQEQWRNTLHWNDCSALQGVTWTCCREPTSSNSRPRVLPRLAGP